MSRSYRKTPVTGITTAASDAEWKAKAARKLRHHVKQALNADLDDIRFSGRPWDVANVWDGPKDGKQYWVNPNPKLMRK